ncbi:DUF2388 domain-containing protein [Bdellovibrio sp. SKB1291214]|uniref:DUF2388 domain-containing protein n=1 Tax=Bdellovibrio sp. SKB1291214 TaxID=1732569 RepID=UPI000B51E478|nr:DUF2388 domain-containing protein [Bdellovibrio sp. SKB1291214]UYL08623.1 DUF2388 domain-containing protein [Bdellovibrio sp. SKB1291214]
MIKILVASVITILVIPMFALAKTGELISGATVAVTSAPTFLTAKTAADNAIEKMIVEAKDDAAVFVATQGQVRGVYLQRALDHIRKSNPRLIASDLQLAERIIAH